MSGLRSSQHFSLDFKLKVIEEYNEGENSLSEISKKYGIRGKSTIRKWIVKFEDKNIEMRPESQENLRRRIRELELELEREKLKRLVAEQTIEIAEKELKISIRKKVRFQTIERMRYIYPQIGLSNLCRLFGVTRQAYYSHWKRKEQKRLEVDQVLKMIRSVREVHPKMGCRKIYSILKRQFRDLGIKVGRDGLFDIMSVNQLLIRKRKRSTRTTNSYHSFRKYKNLIKDFTPYQANQLWVSDITYIKNEQGFKYLFLITDAYSKKIVGHKIADTLETKHAIESLRMALNEGINCEGIIHHSDRGIQYCLHEYVKLLQDYKINISMTEDSNPTDNSIAERVNGILKQEYIEPLKKSTNHSLESIVEQSVSRYNNYRPHLSCNLMTPKQAHHIKGTLKRKWKNYYKLKPNIN